MAIERDILTKIGNDTVTYRLNGDTVKGSDAIIINNEVNLIGDNNWFEAGYTIAPFLQPADFEGLHQLIINYFTHLISQHSTVDLSNFTLEKYHHFVDTDALHDIIIKTMGRGLHTDLLGHYAGKIAERVQQISGTPLRIADFDIFPMFNIRIVRPLKPSDNNPPHKDIYIDRLKNALNIYAPLAGSNLKSSLPIMPGSHLLNENELELTQQGTLVNGRAFHVTTVVSVHNQPLQMVRPNPALNEVMVFTPYAIHGGGFNLNEDLTRFSLEIRFVRA